MADNTVKTVFTADATNATQGANEAATAVEKSADKQTVAVDKAADSYAKVGRSAAESGQQAVDSWEKQVGAVTRFIGKITAAIGVATGFYVIGVKIREVWDSIANATDRASASAEKFAQSIDYADAAKGVAQLDKELAAVHERIAALQEAQPRFAPGFFSQDIADEEKKAADLQRQRDILTQKRDADAAKQQADADAKKLAEQEKANQEHQLEQQRAINAAAASQSAADDASLDRAKRFADEAASITAGLIVDDIERARTEFALAEQKRRHDLAMAQTQAEADAIRALILAAEKKLQADITKIVDAANKEREERLKKSVAIQIAEWNELREAIDAVYRAQVQAAQGFTTGFGNDIRAIKNILLERGSWKR